MVGSATRNPAIATSQFSQATKGVTPKEHLENLNYIGALAKELQETAKEKGVPKKMQGVLADIARKVAANVAFVNKAVRTHAVTAKMHENRVHEDPQAVFKATERWRSVEDTLEDETLIVKVGELNAHLDRLREIEKQIYGKKAKA